MPTPLILVAAEVVDVTAPAAATTLVIEPLHIVSPSVPSPTLTDGRPQ